MKFKVGDEVRLNIKRSTDYLEGFHTRDICTITKILKNSKRYQIINNSNQIYGYCDEDELEFAKMKIIVHSTGFSISDDHTVDALKYAVNKMQEPVEYDTKCLGIYNKGEKYMKILEIYSRRIIKEIDNELTEKIKEINSEDNVRKILQEAENQLNVLLNRDETNPIILRCDVNCEEKTSKAIAVFQEERDEKERQLNELLTEIKAQLEITETYEQKMDILVRYGILNEQWKISDGSEEEPVRKVRKVK